MASCTIYGLSSRATQQRRSRHWDATAKIKSNSFHVQHSAPSLFVDSSLFFHTKRIMPFVYGGFNWDICRISLFASVINQQIQPESFHGTFYFLVCTDKCQVTKKPTGRARLLAGCQSLVLWQRNRQSVCYLSERCEEWFCSNKRVTICLVSVRPVRDWCVLYKKNDVCVSLKPLHQYSMFTVKFSSCVCLLGDYFGILLEEKVTVFPFNIMENPMYWGSTANYLGLALM